jgi:hypothetical protein
MKNIPKWKNVKIFLIIILVLVGLRFSSYIFGAIGFFILYLLEYWFISIPIVFLTILLIKNYK